MALRDRIDRVVLPGQTVGAVPAEGAVRVGHGLAQAGDAVVATKAGVLRHRAPDTYYVENSQMRVRPRRSRPAPAPPHPRPAVITHALIRHPLPHLPCPHPVSMCPLWTTLSLALSPIATRTAGALTSGATCQPRSQCMPLRAPLKRTAPRSPYGPLTLSYAHG